MTRILSALEQLPLGRYHRSTVLPTASLPNSNIPFLVAAVIASAVVPTMIAGLAFVPQHLLPSDRRRVLTRLNGLNDKG